MPTPLKNFPHPDPLPEGEGKPGCAKSPAYGRVWQCGSHRLPIGQRTLIMGVINVTPDSFSDGGMFPDTGAAIAHGHRLVEEGADLLDIGGESSRPGAQPVPESAEKDRVVPVIEGLKDCGVPISVDTWKAGAADAACSAGADIINDITALRGDPDMARIAANHGAGLVLMHMRGTPATMQSMTDYPDLIGEVYAFLEDAVALAVRTGVQREAIAVDPGIGFGKTPEQNIELLRHLQHFRGLECPILVGTSRKSFLGHFTGRPVNERVSATAGSVACAIAHGADIVRVHDVGAMCDVVRIADVIERSTTG
ncbi:MAG: dihydropteroate synthase [bacterium]